MFLISSTSDNIMVEELSIAVISCYQRVLLMWRGSEVLGLKPLGGGNIECNYVPSWWLVQAGGTLSCPSV